MGLRVRAVLLVLSLLALVALAIPLALSLADGRTAALTSERERQLAALADAAAMPVVPLEALVDRYHRVYGEGVLVVDADGRTLAARGLDYADADVRVAASHALVDAPATPWTRVLPWSSDRVLAATGVQRDGEPVGAVVLAVDTAAAAHDVAIRWLWLALGCAALLGVAALVARALTRWVLHPVDGLERAVADMTRGVAGPPADVAGPPELRHFTAAFNTMAQVVRASLDRQRRLIADASHQLRNPLAAVRLRADSLDDCVIDAGRATYTSMTAELDRLEDLLGQLLRLARAEELSHSRRLGMSSATADVTDLADVAEERVAFWRGADGRQVRTVIEHPGPAVQLARHDVEQLLDVVIDNALRYAGAEATVTVSAESGGETVVLVVSDDGPGLPDEDLVRAAARFWRGHDDDSGSGLGLAIAGEIAGGHGGAMTLDRAPEGGVLVRFTLPAAGAS